MKSLCVFSVKIGFRKEVFMNEFQGIGRLTRDPEVRYNADNKAVARYTLAINRNFKNKDGNYDADFINCVTFGQRAEFAEKYLKKGMKIAVTGEIRTDSYVHEDKTVYTWAVVVAKHEFCETRSGAAVPDSDGFVSAPEDDEELPFQ